MADTQELDPVPVHYGAPDGEETLMGPQIWPIRENMITWSNAGRPYTPIPGDAYVVRGDWLESGELPGTTARWSLHEADQERFPISIEGVTIYEAAAYAGLGEAVRSELRQRAEAAGESEQTISQKLAHLLILLG